MIDWYPKIKDGGVVFIDVYTNGQSIRLAGYDNYWRHGNNVGMFNDPEHIEEFGHLCSFHASEQGFIRTDIEPPKDAHILRGVWLPDEEYKEMLLNE